MASGGDLVASTDRAETLLSLILRTAELTLAIANATLLALFDVLKLCKFMSLVASGVGGCPV